MMVPVEACWSAQRPTPGAASRSSSPGLILPIRGALYTLSDNPFWLVGVQLLDGVGAEFRGAFPVIVADLMRGTGRFNVAKGRSPPPRASARPSIPTIAGVVVVHAGYSAAF